MSKSVKVLRFKLLPPFFELCRDGQKPFDIRLWDSKDTRFRALAQMHYPLKWWIEFENPTSGETFQRELQEWKYLENWNGTLVKPLWIILYLGELKSP